MTARSLFAVIRVRLAIWLMLLSMVLGMGCKTTRSAKLSSHKPPSLSWLRGQPVLVIAGSGGEGSPEAQEAALTRALSTVSVRAWPTDADADLRTRLLDEGRGETRLERAREAAEQRRIPWLVVTGDELLRVEDTRGGEVRWESVLRATESADRRAGALRDAIGPESGQEQPIKPADVRLAPSTQLGALRRLAVRGDWKDHSHAVALHLVEWPADSAVLVHSVLADLLGEEPSGAAEATVRRAIQLNPDGENELLALALMAEHADRLAFALRARSALVRLFPRRIDYRPELADLHGELGTIDKAVAVVRGSLGSVSRDRLEDLPAGTAPHDEPDALPYADLRFTLGWFLGLQGESEAALLSYEKALTIYGLMGRPREQSDAVNNAGVVLVEAGRPAVAVPLFRKARRLREEQGRATKAANSLHNLARALADSRRVPEAIETYEEAARDYEELGDPLSAIESLYETMEHHAATGDVNALERRADRLLAKLTELEEGGATEKPRRDALRGSIWFERAEGRMTLRNPEGALEAYTVALDVYRRQGRRLDEAQTLYSMAVPNMALFRLDDAYVNLMDALALAVELNDSQSILDIRRQIHEVGGLIRGAGRTPPSLPDALVPFME